MNKKQAAAAGGFVGAVFGGTTAWFVAALILVQNAVGTDLNRDNIVTRVFASPTAVAYALGGAVVGGFLGLCAGYALGGRRRPPA